MNLIVNELLGGVELRPSLATNTVDIASFNSCSSVYVGCGQLGIANSASRKTSDETELANAWFCSGTLEDA